MPAKEAAYISRQDIIKNGWIKPNNLQIELLAHTFDSDDNITNLTMRYELVCFMKDGTTEYKLLDEFDIMPYKITSGMVDGMNHFLFNQSENLSLTGKNYKAKRWFIAEMQPNHKNMFKMTIPI